MKNTNQAFRFHFKPVNREQRSLVHHWLKEPHVAKWFYGQGLQNTFNHLELARNPYHLEHYDTIYG